MAARAQSCSCSCPPAGGAAKSGSITLKRKCAQRSWGRDRGEVFFIGCRWFCFSHHCGGAASVYTGLGGAVARHPVRELGRASHNQFFPGTRSGDRGQELEQIQQPVTPLNLKALAERQRHGFRAQRRHEAGTGLPPKGTFQESDHHHCRHRSNVRRSMPKVSRSDFTRSGVNPWTMAETSTTTRPA